MTATVHGIVTLEDVNDGWHPELWAHRIGAFDWADPDLVNSTFRRLLEHSKGTLWEREAEREKLAALDTWDDWLVTDTGLHSSLLGEPSAWSLEPVRNLERYPSRTGLCGIRDCAFTPHGREQKHTWEV